MTFSEIIDGIMEKKWEINNRIDRLIDAYCVGEELPDGFNSWTEVGVVIARLEKISEILNNANHEIAHIREIVGGK